MKTRHSTRSMSAPAAEDLALAVFSALASDDERMSRFLAVSGLSAQSIRAAAARPGFFAGVLDYVIGDEPLLLALAQEIGAPPEQLAAAQRALSPLAEE